MGRPVGEGFRFRHVRSRGPPPAEEGQPAPKLVPALALVLIAGVLAAVPHDVGCRAAGNTVAWAPIEVASKPYHGELLLEPVRYDSARRAIIADVTIIVTGTALTAGMVLTRVPFASGRCEPQ